MKHKKIIAVLLLLLTTVGVARAQKDEFNPIYTGVNSLGIAPDSRGGGMGDVGAATDPDINSQYWNPAKYPFAISPAGISVSYTPWLSKLVNDIALINAAGYTRIGDYQALSASIRYFTLGEVIVRSGADDTGYSIKPYELSFDMAYSRMLSETLSAAVALRFIYSDLAFKEDDVSAGSAFAADMALYYNNYVMLGQRECLFSLGLNLSNMGSKISYDSGETSAFLPANFRFGGSLLIPVDEYNTFAFSADINKLMVPTMPKKMEGEADTDYRDRMQEEYYDQSPIKGIFKSWSDAPGGFKEELQEVQISVGAEYIYHNQFSIRAGYHHEHKNKGNRKYFTAGAGFKMSVFSLDAAYLISTAQSNPLDQTLRFTLSFDMDGIKDLLGRR